MSVVNDTPAASGVVSLPADIPPAKLQTIQLQRLHEGDPNEAEKLFAACKKDGFFYLDVQGLSNDVLPLISLIYTLSKELYDLPDEEKMKFDIDKLSKMKLNGYKPVGRNFGGIGTEKRDGFETYALPKDGILSIRDGSFTRPAVVDRHMAALRQFASAISFAAHEILSKLSSSLRLPDGQRLEDYHRAHLSSPDVIRLLKYHSQPLAERGASHTPHTDLGSLTFLFTQQPGLQVLERDTNEWKWVQPKAGHAIVNLGDGLSMLTNRYFHSCLHRVGPLPGRAMNERYSFAYLMRAEDTTPMTGLPSPLIPAVPVDGPVYTSGEWLQRKFNILRLDTRKDEDGWVLMGERKELPA